MYQNTLKSVEDVNEAFASLTNTVHLAAQKSSPTMDSSSIK